MEVAIYSTPTCTFCKATKGFFEKYNVAFKEYDVSTDTDKANEMVQKSGQMAVPVITINKDGDEKIMVGYDEAKLAEALGITL